MVSEEIELPSLEQIEQMEAKRLQAIESLQINETDNTVVCQRMDGSVVSLAQLGSEVIKDSKNQTVSFSQVGSTNTYTATVALNDGSGRNQTFRIDFGDRTGVVKRTVA
jgi:hypothetical protein